MPNSFDTDARGPSTRRLLAIGTCFVVIAAVIVTLLVEKSKGKLDRLVQVNAELVNVGDGLPTKSDVKFRGVLVGFVSDVVPARTGQTNIVHIELRPEYASGIPASVTARVVPSNVFAVSSVQLVDNGGVSNAVSDGTVIHEDQSLPTVLFQTTLTKVREILAAVGRKPDGDSVGVLAAVGEATHGRGDRLLEAGRDLNMVVTRLNSVVATDTGPSTIAALTDAADGLRDTAPALFDALGNAVKPMQTVAEKRSALTSFLSAGLGTAGTLGGGFDHQTDRLINITTELTPVVGVLADHGGEFQPIFTRLQQVANKFYDEAWNPETNLFTIKAIVSFTRSRSYIRADCPRYGELSGPSCQTAPEVPTAPELMPALGSMGYPLPAGVSENRPNFAPPRDSVRGAPEPPPAPTPDAPPAQSPPLDSALLPAESPPSEAPSPPSGAQPQSAVDGGNVGPVGSSQEMNQLSRIVGGEANAATALLLGPVARGATVHIAPGSGGGR